MRMTNATRVIATQNMQHAGHADGADSDEKIGLHFSHTEISQ